MSRTVQEIMEVMGKSVEASVALERKNGSSYYHIADITSEDINEVRYYFDGALYCSVMRCLEIKLKGNWTAKARKGLLLDGFNIKVTHPEGDSITIGYGGFYIAEEPEYDAAQNVTSVIAYDELYPSMQPYAMSLDWTNGITVKNYLIAILNKLGINYDSESLDLMANANVKITSEKFIDIENDNTESAYTYRDVLDEIAKAAGVTFAFRNSLAGDEYKLYAVKPTESGYVIDESNLHSVTVGAKYGPVKAVMLSREPQEDNVYLQADGYKSTDATVKMANVEIMEDSDNDSYRESFMSGILSNVVNTEYYLYELDSFGIGFLNFGDIFTIKACDREGGVIGTEKSYKTIFMRTDMTIGNGIKEKSRLEAPQATSPDYAAASTTDKVLKKAMLKVDKQKQEITALAKESEEKFAQLTLTTEGLYADINDAENGLKATMTATAEKAESAFKKATAVENAGYITTEDAKTLISQSADNITLSVEKNLKIGARNILLDSACFKTFTPTQQRTTAAPVVLHMDGATTPSGEYKAIAWRKTTSADSGGVMFTSIDILGQAENAIKKVKAGTKYTLSFWVKAEDGTSDFSLIKSDVIYTGKGVTYDDDRSVYVKDTDGNIAVTADEWRQVVLVFAVNSGFSATSGAFCIRFLSKATAKVSLDISSLKLEEGNVATDWSPSSEDIDQSVKAQISMCVQKDGNNKLTSAIAIEGNRISIKSDNFELSENGTVTKCTGAKITDGTIVCGEDGFNMTIAAGAISHTMFDESIGGIGGALVSLDWYELIHATNGIDLSVDGGCMLLLNKTSLELYDTTTDTPDLWWKASKGKIAIHGQTTMTIGDTTEWSAGAYSAALRSILTSNVSLVINASDSKHYYPIYLCGESIVFLGKLFFDNYKGHGTGEGTLKVNFETGEIYAD